MRTAKRAWRGGHSWMLLAALALHITSPSNAQEEPSLGRQYYQRWLADVQSLITPAESSFFSRLVDDDEREEFIHQFWHARSMAPTDARYEWTTRTRMARDEYGHLEDDRARATLLYGAPTYRVTLGSETATHPCGFLRPVEIFYYSGRSDGVSYLAFARTNAGTSFELWKPRNGLEPLLALRRTAAHEAILRLPSSAAQEATLDTLEGAGCFIGRSSQRAIAAAALSLDDAADLNKAAFPLVTPEWISHFQDQPRSPNRAPAIHLSYLGTLAATLVDVTVGLSTTTATARRESYTPTAVIAEFSPVGGKSTAQRICAQRYWIPESAVTEDAVVHLTCPVDAGAYTLILRLYIGDNRPQLAVRTIAVPTSGALEGVGEAELLESTLDAVAIETPSAAALGPTVVRAHVLGTRTRSVRFILDGSLVATAAQPPFHAVVDLGQKLLRQRLAVIALAADGTELARDSVVLHEGPHAFRVRLQELMPRSPLAGEAAFQVVVAPPADGTIERVDLFVDEILLASTVQAPWIYYVPLDAGQSAVVRAVARLTDGRSAEAARLVGSAAAGETVDVRMVEFYLAAESGGKPVSDLSASDLEVLEDGSRQTITALDKVSSQPLVVAVMADGSSTMLEELEIERRAALQFFREHLDGDDRAAFIVFNHQTEVVVPFTSDLRWLEEGTAALRASGGTALYNSLVSVLYYFGGMRGRRAVILLTDGKDEGSTLGFDATVEFVRRNSVAIYAIQLDLFIGGPFASPRVAQHDAAADNLRRLARESGGAFHRARGFGELPKIFTEIAEDLRRQYRLAYQSTAGDGHDSFRRVEVRIPSRRAIRVRAPLGYYPR